MMDMAITEGRVISERDLQRLLQKTREAKNLAIKTKAHLIHIQDHYMFSICHGTGVRVDELRRIKWKHFLEGQAVLRVLGKGKKLREVDLGDTVSKRFKEFKRVSTAILKRPCLDDDYIFISNKGGPYRSRSGLWRRMVYWRKRAEFENQSMSFHGIRHKWSTTALNGGVNLKRVSLNLGHSKVSTTLDLYYHLTEDSKQKIKELF